MKIVKKIAMHSLVEVIAIFIMKKRLDGCRVKILTLQPEGIFYLSASSRSVIREIKL